MRELVIGEVVQPTEEKPENSGKLLILPNDGLISLESTPGAMDGALSTRARRVAMILGIRVLPYERMYSGSSTPRRRSTRKAARRAFPPNPSHVGADGMAHEITRMANTAAQLRKRIESDTDAETLVAAGHSGAGTEALGIVAAEEFEVEHVSVTEAYAILGESALRATAEFIRHNIRDEEYPPPAAPDQESHVSSGPLREAEIRALDLYHNSLRMPYMPTAANLDHIAHNIPQTRVSGTFAGITPNGDPDEIEEMLELINNIRDDGSIQLRTRRELTHGAFNDHNLYAEQLASDLDIDISDSRTQ